MSALINMYLRVNYEEPKDGWPPPPTISRPRGKWSEQAEREKPQMASPMDLVNFTIENRDE